LHIPTIKRTPNVIKRAFGRFEMFNCVLG